MEERWYMNRDLLIAAHEQYGSLEAAAEAIGGASASTLQKTWRRHNLPPLPPGPSPSKPNQEALKRLAESVYGGS